MKSFVLCVLLSFGFSVYAHGSCVFNTDSSEVFGKIDFEDSMSVWKYMSKNQDCLIPRMRLGRYEDFHDTEVIVFNYQNDIGKFPDIVFSSVATCKRIIDSGLVSCRKEE